MADKPVLKLVEYNQDCRSISVLETLKNAVRDLEECPEENNFSKAIVIFLNDRDGDDYRTSYAAAGMKRSEIIALLEVTKLQFMRGLIGERSV